VVDAQPTKRTADPNSAVKGFLRDLVVELTGYERQILDFDADLEAELGLDSIKFAQIVGEMQEQFELREIRADQLSLGDFRTLRAIQSFLLSTIEQQGGKTISPVVAAEFTTSPLQTPVVQAELQAVIGVEAYDQLPEDWAALFQARCDADNVVDARRVGMERGARH
jgi:acyl carrier protein